MGDNLKRKCANLFTKIVLKNGQREAEEICGWIYHQPKVPDKLKKWVG